MGTELRKPLSEKKNKGSNKDEAEREESDENIATEPEDGNSSRKGYYPTGTNAT